MKKSAFVYGPLLAFLLSDVAFAKDLPDHYREDMMTYGIEEIHSFPAPDATGYLLVDDSGQLFTAYVMDSSDSVIVGTMYDSTGNDLSAEVINRYAYRKLESSNMWFARGNSEAPYVYVVDDPMCPYCHKQFELMKDSVEDGSLQVRHLVVGLLGEQSQKVANEILESDAPAVLLSEHHANFNEGGIPGIAPNYRQKQKISSHNDLMYELGVFGTPAIFYEGENGMIHKIGGFTDDLSGIMADLGSLPQ